MGFIDTRETRGWVRGVERSLEVQVGALGGFELRPTRLFLWAGPSREGRERIVSVGRPPRRLVLPRRERELAAGPVRVRARGRASATVALAAVEVARAVRRRK